MSGARTIDDVLADLTRIVETGRSGRSRLAVFPAMYRSVTATVGDGIQRGVFDDGPRVQRLVVNFADLYIEAFDAWDAGVRPAESWALAFEFAATGRGSIMQHLLLGMNAHINLDLAVATASISVLDDHERLERDFVRVNEVLFALLDEFQRGIGDLSPWMGWLDRAGFGWDEACMRLGIRAARDAAWELSGRLVSEPLAAPELVAARDAETRRAGLLVCGRLSPFAVANRLVATRECRDVERVVDTLAAVTIDVSACWSADRAGGAG
jgi:hypothetical protein